MKKKKYVAYVGKRLNCFADNANCFIIVILNARNCIGKCIKSYVRNKLHYKINNDLNKYL